MVRSADNNWLQFASWAILFTSTAEELNWKVCSLTVAVFVLTPKVCSASGNQFTFDLALCIINTRIIQDIDFLPKWNEWTSIFMPRQAPPKLLRNSHLMVGQCTSQRGCGWGSHRRSQLEITAVQAAQVPCGALLCGYWLTFIAC